MIHRMRKEVKQYIRGLEARGWYVKRKAGTGHIIMYYPPGGSVTVPVTPSDHCWMRNNEEDVRSVERQYGPYVPPPKAQRKEKGLDYVAPVREEPEPTPLGIALYNAIQSIPEREPPQIREPIKFQPAPTVIKTQPKQGDFMSNLDKDLIITLLSEKHKLLKDQLGPYLELFKEYQRVEATLKQMGRIEIPDEKKVEEFLEKKSITKERTFLDNKKFYADIQEICVSHGGKIQISELCEWLQNVKGYSLKDIRGSSPRAYVLEKLQLFNKTYPEKASLILGPTKPPGEGRVRKYEYVEFKDLFEIE